LDWADRHVPGLSASIVPQFRHLTSYYFTSPCLRVRWAWNVTRDYFCCSVLAKEEAQNLDMSLIEWVWSSRFTTEFDMNPFLGLRVSWQWLYITTIHWFVNDLDWLLCYDADINNILFRNKERKEKGERVRSVLRANAWYYY
jgi:hypothetical protein